MNLIDENLIKITVAERMVNKTPDKVSLEPIIYRRKDGAQNEYEIEYAKQDTRLLSNVIRDKNTRRDTADDIWRHLEHGIHALLWNSRGIHSLDTTGLINRRESWMRLRAKFPSSASTWKKTRIVDLLPPLVNEFSKARSTTRQNNAFLLFTPLLLFRTFIINVALRTTNTIRFVVR